MFILLPEIGGTEVESTDIGKTLVVLTGPSFVVEAAKGDMIWCRI